MIGPVPSDVKIEGSKLRSRFCVVSFDAIHSDEFRSVPPAARHVYMAIALFAGATSRVSFPYQRTLAEITGMRRETVSRAVAQLVRAGLLEKETRRRNNLVVGSAYRLILPPSKRMDGWSPEVTK